MSGPMRLAVFEAREEALRLAVEAWCCGALLFAEREFTRACNLTERLGRVERAT